MEIGFISQILVVDAETNYFRYSPEGIASHQILPVSQRELILVF